MLVYLKLGLKGLVNHIDFLQKQGKGKARKGEGKIPFSLSP